MKFIKFLRVRTTIGALFSYETSNKGIVYFIQFSFKDPWFKPQKRHMETGNGTCYGWLFFYAGVMHINPDKEKEIEEEAIR